MLFIGYDVSIYPNEPSTQHQTTQIQEENAALQNSTTQQILEELNSKCADYEQQIASITAERDAIHQTNAKLLVQIEQLDRDDSALGKETAEMELALNSLKEQLEERKHIVDQLQSENEGLCAVQQEHVALKQAHSELEAESDRMVYNLYIASLCT